MSIVSKSKYLNGLQCHKLLWYTYNQKDDIPEPDQATQTIFEQGHQVGQLAKQLFPGGVEVKSSHDNFAEMLSETEELLKLRKPIFEASFRYNNGFARADVLNPVGKDSWDIIEVKSSTEVKDINLSDLAFQKYVYEGAGLKINKCHLMYINNKYVRKGEVESSKLFKQKDVTDEVKLLVKEIEQNLGKMLNVIKQKESPNIPIGIHCNKPYNCPLQSVCWGFLPQDNILTLYRLKKEKAFELIYDGILDIRDLPESFKASKNQKIQIDAVNTKNSYIDNKKIQSFLETVQYPIYALDFETFMTAIPMYDLVQPYKQVPFQYSLHILKSKDDNPEHHSFLADGKMDPRPELLKSLKELLQNSGSIMSYNATFEKRVLKDCSNVYPEYKKWYGEIEKRFIDLLKPFQSFAYYNPNQQGTASIKAVR